ncbi:MAG TPA: CRISPR-associated helicase Cas3' [Saprospiraceae bacterium]|nr:CRISPR-associated helicase Cas3' [Saprospiraceae bacterium]
MKIAMFNSYSTVSEILKRTIALNKILINSETYYAHISPRNSTLQLEPETLQQHIELVQEKFELLCKLHCIDNVLNSLIFNFLKKYGFENDVKTANYVKTIFVNTIVFHDFGKINENFQASPDKMNNPNFQGKERFQTVISTHHSALGAYLFIVKHLEEVSSFEPNKRGLLSHCILVFSYPIFKHHANRLNDEYQDTIGFSEEQVKCMKEYIKNYQYDINTNFSERFVLQENTKKAFAQFDEHLKQSFSFELYALIRLNFSILTASDYLASSQYMIGNRAPLKDFGILSNERILKLFEFVSGRDILKNGKTNYNKSTYQKINTGFKLQNPKEQSGNNLNVLRQEMALQVIENIKLNSDKNLFYIEAPTGGGKTNLSMLATVELLKEADGKLNKVFYVFPFTTLITQTYSAIIDTLGLDENEVTQLHSKAGYKNKEEDRDGLYSDEKQNYIENLFVNYPFCLLSHVKFFDLLKSNEKEANYQLHRLANSIVVIDELQSYNPSHWDKMMYFIRHFSKHFNIKFILMSATLPKLGDLEIIKEEAKDIVYLLPNAKQDYFLNPNFKQRVNFNFDYFERKDLKLDEIANLLHSKSKDYSGKDFGTAKPKNSVYTIIEFIFKKTATEFCSEINKINDGFFNEIFILSGTILEHRRKYIINFLKNPENRKKRILLITTQVVEAGVDIDMDLGFKDRSLIDSEEQLAGRINRNVNKQDCILFLFNYNKEIFIYGQDKRYEETKKLSSHEYARILDEKDFDFLYNKVLANIQFWNENNQIDRQNNKGLLKHYRKNIENLKFQSTHFEFKLIDQENLSCFIPMEIPVKVGGLKSGSYDEIFNKNELAFLAQNNIFPNQDNKIEGSQVFDIYLGFIQNKREYITQKIGEKTLQGIMSKFIFSLFATESIKKQIVLFSDEVKSEYGYKYVDRWFEFYRESTGMEDMRFQSNETQFL